MEMDNPCHRELTYLANRKCAQRCWPWSIWRGTWWYPCSSNAGPWFGLQVALMRMKHSTWIGMPHHSRELNVQPICRLNVRPICSQFLGGSAQIYSEISCAFGHPERCHPLPNWSPHTPLAHTSHKTKQQLQLTICWIFLGPENT